MVDGEKEGVLAELVVCNFEDEDGVIIVLRPRGNLCGIESVKFNHLPGELIEEAMFPGDEDKGVLVGGLFQFAGKLVNFLIAVGGVDWELAADRRGLDGDKRTDIVLAIVDLLRGIGCKDKRGGSVFKKHTGQCERPVESAATQVPEPSRRFFSMPNGDNRFGVGIHRRGRDGGGVRLPKDRTRNQHKNG